MRDYKELVSVLRCEADGFLMEDTPDVLMADSLNDAADAIEDLIAALTASNEVIAKSRDKWISVEEKLPEKYHQVLVYGQNGLQIDYYAGAKSVCGNPLFMISEAKATHWMPLPEPPKEDDNA